MKIVILDSENRELNFLEIHLSEFNPVTIFNRESFAKTLSENNFNLLIVNKHQLENIRLDSCKLSYLVVCPKYYQITNSRFNQENTNTTELLTTTAKIINLLSGESKITFLEEKLRNAEEKFNVMYDNSPLAYQSLNVNGEIIDVNPHWLKTLGYKREEVIGKSFGEFWPDNVRNIFPERFSELKKAGCKNNLQLMLEKKNGGVVNASFEAKVGYNPDGSFKQTYCVFKDVTQEQKILDELKTSEERLNLAIESSKDGLFDWNIVTNEIYYSYGWKEMLGYGRDELENKFEVWEKLTEPSDVKRTWDLFSKVVNKEEEHFYSEFKMKHKNGNWVNILSRGEIFFDEDNKPVRMIGIHTDITQTKRLENSIDILTRNTSGYLGKKYLNEIAIQLANILEADFLIICEFLTIEEDKIFTNSYCNKNEILEPIVIDKNDELAKKIFKNRSFVYKHNKKTDKTYLTILETLNAEELLAVPLIDSNNEVIGLIYSIFSNPIKDSKFSETLLRVFSLRISSELERYKINNKLIESERLLKDSQHIANVGGWSYNPDDKSIKLTDEVFRIFEMNEYVTDPNDVDTQRQILSRFSIAEKEILEEDIINCITIGKGFDRELEYQNNENFKWLRINGKAVQENNKTVKLIGNIVDISEKKNVELELREKIKNLERFNNVSVDRELKMLELKNEINHLRDKLGLEKKYGNQ